MNSEKNIGKKIVLITGGQRSGKSLFGEQTALSLSENPVYMATSRIWDDEHRRRIEIHQRRRSSQWHNIEEEKFLSCHNVSGRVVLIDCLTLWATNFFFDLNDEELALIRLKDEFDRFTKQDAHFLFVTNEIGMGEMSVNSIQRKFADLLGRLNQYVASHADEVILCVSGIPVKIK